MSRATDKIAEIEARRAARGAAEQAEADTQRAIDLEAIEALEAEHGYSGVSAVRVKYVEGLPTMIAVRTPRPAEMKRFRDSVTPRKHPRTGVDQTPNYGAATEQLGAACLNYPSPEVFAELCEKRPGAAVGAGSEALKLAATEDEDAGKS